MVRTRLGTVVVLRNGVVGEGVTVRRRNGVTVAS
jgi:hypothetical protein